MDFSRRYSGGEAMDDPSLEMSVLAAVFRDLNRTNLLLGGQAITLRALKKMLKSTEGKVCRIADMGCGDGDLLRRLAKWSRKIGIPVELIGVDASSIALEIAKRRSAAYPEIRYQQADLQSPELNAFRCDIVLCSLTLHHFGPDEIPTLLSRFGSMASRGIIINDLQRNPIAYYLFHGFSLIFIKTRIAKKDGLISIRRGFRKGELLALSRSLPEWKHEIRWQWIFRYLWVMKAKSVPTYE